jgi:hypothetical protein
VSMVGSFKSLARKKYRPAARTVPVKNSCVILSVTSCTRWALVSLMTKAVENPPTAVKSNTVQ